MTDQSEWTGKVGNAWADEWKRTDRSFGPVTDRLLEVAQAKGFAQALDVGCGAGEVSLALAAGDPTARVIGVDISADLLEVARQRGAGQQNLRFELGDAARWTPGAGEQADLVISRHGVMFFGDPIAAFAHIADQAAPSARLVFSCFRERTENPWVREIAAVLPPSDEAAPDPDAPGPFAFGRRARVEDILRKAGWQGIAFEPIDYRMIGGEGEQAIEDALSYFLRIGPAARAIGALGEAERDAAMARLRAMLERHCVDAQVALPAAGWIVTARVPD